MAEESFKIRLRFPSGEEFEAQGNQQFVEQQRNYFLTLIGKQKGRTSTLSAEPALSRTPAFTEASVSSAAPSLSPLSAPGKRLPPLSILPPAEREAAPAESPTAPAGLESSGAFPALRLWERLLKEDGEIVLLRKKCASAPKKRPFSCWPERVYCLKNPPTPPWTWPDPSNNQVFPPGD